MKKDTYNPQLLKIKEGCFIEQQYDGSEMLKPSIDNWQYLCPYRLRPDSFSGRVQILHLHSMQIVFSERNGGTMQNVRAAKDSLNIAIVESCTDKACFGRIKLKTDDILFFDDRNPHNFITNDSIKFIVVSISKSDLGSRLSNFSEILDYCIYDTDTRLATMLHETWKRFTVSSEKKKTKRSYQKAEEQILSIVMELFSEQTPVVPKLTKGEKTALNILDQATHHMDGKISISSLAEEHKISEKTLENSFKALFDFTPKRLLQQLKLNLVHHELQKGNPEENMISKTALKWGFKHMGRFSSCYKELFGANPSQTLKTPFHHKDDIEAMCVSRKEMM